MGNKNSEGYTDSTASKAVEMIDREERDVRKLMQTIQNICSLSGFKIVNRIEFECKRSGHRYD